MASIVASSGAAGVDEPALADFDSVADFTLEVIIEKINSASGVKNRVVGSEEKKIHDDKEKAREHVTPKALVNTASEGKLMFVDEAQIKQALATLRNDKLSTTWVLTSYVRDNTLKLEGSGEGGVEDMLKLCQPDTIQFGILRLFEQIDKSVVTRFVFIKWIPDSVPPLQKAKISTKKGLIDPFFQPFHVDFTISRSSEISTALVVDKITSMSGSKSKVVDKK